MQGRFLNLIGGASVTVGDFSGGAGQIIMPHVLGDMEVYSRQTSWWQVLKNTETFVLIGTDPHKNGRAEGGTTDHSMFPRWEIIKEADVDFISINPQRTTTDTWLDARWVQIVPNTDTALFIAMSHFVYRNELHDQNFLETHTVGHEKFIDYLMGKSDGVVKSAEWAAEITGIPHWRIEWLARLCATTRTQFAGSWAIQRAQHGEMPYWAITAFAAMTGQIGLPGGGVGFSWHWGQGGALFAQARAPGGVPQGRNRVRGICPASRLNEMLQNPGKKFTRNGGTFGFPDVHMIYNSGNNFASHQQDTNELLSALTKVRTIVCQDPWWTASAQFADIILPATSTVERNEISSGGTYSKDKVYAMRQIIEPLGESLDDFEIFRRLAEIFDVEAQYTNNMDRMEIIEDSYYKSTASDHMDFDEFWETGVARVPTPQEEFEWVRHGAFREDPEANPLATPSGKVELFSQTIADMNLADCPPMPTWLEPDEYLGNGDPDDLHVVSPHPYNRIHSQFAQSNLRHELNIEDREFLLINEKDALERGISDGDLVELYNDRGAVIVGARVSGDIMRGVVSLYEGAWLSFDSKGRCNSGAINVLTSSRRSSGLSQATTANTCLAKLRPATDVDGPNMAYDGPKIAKEPVSLDTASFGLDRAGSLLETYTAEMEPGERIFYEKCTLCHVPQDPAAHTMTQWKGITLASAVTDFDGARRFRLRYDSPSLNNFIVSAAYGQEVLARGNDQDYADLAVRYSNNDLIEGMDFRAGIGYNWRSNSTDFMSGSFGLLHRDTGLNLHIAAGHDDNSASYAYVKAGIIRDFFGSDMKTAFSIDYYKSDDVGDLGVEADSVALSAVQFFPNNLQVFAQYRTHGRKDTTDTYLDGNAVFIGARYNFSF